MATRETLFTSESVSEGHPDKICDQISDAVLDAYIALDSKARVACESLVTTNRVVVAGEVTAAGQEKVDVEKIARQVCLDIGYNDDAIGFNGATANVEVLLHPQSPDIAQGVDEGRGIDLDMGAGDQGLMFGFAINETPELMPLPIQMAHELMSYLAKIRHEKKIAWLLPDSKSQVTVKYVDGKPVGVDAVVVSTQHRPGVTHRQIEETIIEEIVKKVIPANLLAKTQYHINPTGKFEIGGPHGDCGLTGRKIIVDTYGGYARHGGGAFSGKDPSKVDRSAAYMARYVAKNVVAAGLATKCEVQLAYAIGVSKPVSVLVETFGTATIAEEEIAKRVQANFDLRPRGIIESLGLQRMHHYRETAAYGHFGRDGSRFAWENTDKAAALKG